MARAELERDCCCYYGSSTVVLPCWTRSAPSFTLPGGVRGAGAGLRQCGCYYPAGRGQCLPSRCRMACAELELDCCCYYPAGRATLLLPPAPQPIPLRPFSLARRPPPNSQPPSVSVQSRRRRYYDDIPAALTADRAPPLFPQEPRPNSPALQPPQFRVSSRPDFSWRRHCTHTHPSPPPSPPGPTPFTSQHRPNHTSSCHRQSQGFLLQGFPPGGAGSTTST